MQARLNRAAHGGGRTSRRGGVLALVVVAVLAVATLSASMLQLSGSTTRRQVSNTNLKLAFYMAESGLAEAYDGLAVGKTGNVGSQAAPARFGSGLFWVEATENADGTVTLQSVGMYGNGRAELSLVVEPRLSSVAALGVFADDGLTLGPGMQADGYDSGASEYEASLKTGLVSGGTLSGTTLSTGGLLGGTTVGTTTGSTEPVTVSTYESPPLGKLGSNGDIVLNATAPQPIVVDGDLIPGPAHQVVGSPYATVNGSTEPAATLTVLPPVTVPSFPPSPGVSHSGAIPYVVLPGQHQLPYLQAAAGAQVVIQGPATVVVERLELAGAAELSFDTTGGPVNLYVTARLDWQPGSLVSTSGEKAWEVTIQVPGPLAPPARLAATGDFHGIVYAPEAEVLVSSSLELYGSLVAETLDFQGPVQVHYDQHLEEIAEELALPRLVSWRIVQLSNPPALSQVMDPYRFLGVTWATSPDPDEAHADQQLDVTYEVLPGVTLTYSGLESGFDWTTVTKVHSISRDGVKVDPDGGGLAEFTSDMPTMP